MILKLTDEKHYPLIIFNHNYIICIISLTYNTKTEYLHYFSLGKSDQLHLTIYYYILLFCFIYINAVNVKLPCYNTLASTFQLKQLGFCMHSCKPVLNAGVALIVRHHFKTSRTNLCGLCWLTMALAVSLRYTSQSVSGMFWSAEKGYLGTCTESDQTMLRSTANDYIIKSIISFTTTPTSSPQSCPVTVIGPHSLLHSTCLTHEKGFAKVAAWLLCNLSGQLSWES